MVWPARPAWTGTDAWYRENKLGNRLQRLLKAFFKSGARSPPRGRSPFQEGIVSPSDLDHASREPHHDQPNAHRNTALHRPAALRSLHRPRHPRLRGSSARCHLRRRRHRHLRRHSHGVRPSSGEPDLDGAGQADIDTAGLACTPNQELDSTTSRPPSTTEHREPSPPTSASTSASTAETSMSRSTATSTTSPTSSISTA